MVAGNDPYLGGSEGAPPPPPPGGYRGNSRVSRLMHPAAPPLPAPAAPAIPVPRPPSSRAAKIFGAIVIAHALWLLFRLLLPGAGSYYFTVGAITVQVLMLIAAVVILVGPRGRRLGTIALVVTLVVNVATVGSVSALESAQSGNYDDYKTAEQRKWNAYPGIRGVDPAEILEKPSLEEDIARTDDLNAKLRAALSTEFGITWTMHGKNTLRNNRNGYGGESMLVDFSGPVWTSDRPMQSVAEKRRLRDVVTRVMMQNGVSRTVVTSDPSFQPDPGNLERFYGSANPDQQHTWAMVSVDRQINFYVDVRIFDLSKDPTGAFRTEREGQSARDGTPLEGIQISARGYELLGSDKRDEFIAKLKTFGQ
ncbi:hypothetical protein [Mycetocola saprophilus]|uniref:hypothetical protein n=1 Tax=Mycetocola saprophilus TaxID=76636 RepID=UPI003BF40527